MVQLTDIPLSESLTSGLHSIAHTISDSTTYIQSHEGQEAELAWAHSRLATCSKHLNATGDLSQKFYKYSCYSFPIPLPR